MNSRCDIVDFLTFYDFECCELCMECCKLCKKCCMRNACFLTMVIGFEYEDIIIYSEGE